MFFDDLKNQLSALLKLPAQLKATHQSQQVATNVTDRLNNVQNTTQGEFFGDLYQKHSLPAINPTIDISKSISTPEIDLNASGFNPISTTQSIIQAPLEASGSVAKTLGQYNTPFQPFFQDVSKNIETLKKATSFYDEYQPSKTLTEQGNEIKKALPDNQFFQEMSPTALGLANSVLNALIARDVYAPVKDIALENLAKGASKLPDSLLFKFETSNIPSEDILNVLRTGKGSQETQRFVRDILTQEDKQAVRDLFKQARQTTEITAIKKGEPTLLGKFAGVNEGEGIGFARNIPEQQLPGYRPTEPQVKFGLSTQPVERVGGEDLSKEISKAKADGKSFEEFTKEKGIASNSNKQLKELWDKTQETTVAKKATLKKVGLEKPRTLITRSEHVLLRERIRAEARGAKWGKKVATEKIKQLKDDMKAKNLSIKETKSKLIDYAKANLPLRERGKLLTQIKNIKTEKNLSKAIDLVDKYAENYKRKVLLSDVVKELKNIKPKKVNGILRGKFTADTQDLLNQALKGINKNREEALAKKIENIQKYQEGKITYEEMRKANRLLNVIGLKNMSSQELADFLDKLREIKEYGMLKKDIIDFNKQVELQRIKDNIIDEITGKKGLKKGAEGLPPEKEKRILLKKIHYGQLGWDDLLDNLSKFSKTKPFQSKLSKFGSQVHYAEGLEDAGTEKAFQDVIKAYKNAYGITKDSEIRKKLASLKEEINLGKFENADGHQIELKLTKGQMMQKYAEMQNPALDETFSEGMKWTPKIKKAISDTLTPQDKKAVREIMKFYDKYYDSINLIFRYIFGVDLPKNKNFVPISRDIDTNIPESILLAKDAQHFASVRNGSLKSRVKNIYPLKFNDINDVLVNHIIQMEHFKAWEKIMGDLRKVFMDKDVRQAIKQQHGETALKTLDTLLNNMARGGVDKALIVKGVDYLRKAFVKSILGLKPVIALKQIPSLLAYTTEMPIKDFFSGVFDFWKNPIKNYKTLIEKSPYLRERFGDGFERDIKFALKKNGAGTLVKSKNISDIFLKHIRLGDKFAVLQGSWAKYQSALKEGLSDEEAIKIAEQSTKRTQPTSGATTLSTWQQGGSWMKLFTMFQNQPNKYYRIIANNFRNFKYGRGSRAKAIYNLLLTWSVLPMIFQYISDAFQFKTKHQIRASLLGQYNDILAISNLVQSIYGWSTGEPFGYQGSPVFSSTNELQKAITKTAKLVKEGLDPYKKINLDDLVKAIEYFAKFGGEVSGLPTPYAVQVEKGIRNKDLRQLIFSQYSLGYHAKKKTYKVLTEPNAILRKYGIGKSVNPADAILRKYGIK